MLRNILRFVTGADVLTIQRISVRLVCCDSEFTRRPIAHTCGCVLELPSNYESFVEFSREFNGMLESRIWIMDIISSCSNFMQYSHSFFFNGKCYALMLRIVWNILRIICIFAFSMLAKLFYNIFSK